MPAHVPTKQIIDYIIQNAKKISVDGVIYTNFKVDYNYIEVDKYTFPTDYFDIGGMDPNSLILADTGHEWRRVQFHDDNNVTLNHPDWTIEPYDAGKIRNREVSAIASQTPFNK